MTRPTLPTPGDPATNGTWGPTVVSAINAVSDKADTTASTVATLQSAVAAIPAVNTSITIAGDGTPTLAVAGGSSASTLKLGNSGTDPSGGWTNDVVGTWMARSNWSNLAAAQWLSANPSYVDYTTAHPTKAADLGTPVVPHDSGTALDTLFDMVTNNTPITGETVHDIDGTVITTPNQVFTSMGKSLARLGIATNYLRWFWEMNQNIYSFTAAKYIAAVQHAIPLVNAAFTAECTRLGYTKVIKHVFSPISDGKPFAQFYFGDAYVDVIAPDVYGTIWGTTTPSVATLTASVQGYLDSYATFATAHSKPVGLGEWGNFSIKAQGTADSQGLGDCVQYIDTIINWLKAQNAVYAVYFNINGGGSGQTLANTPNALAELIVAQQGLAGSTGTFSLGRKDRTVPLPTGTPAVGQVPVVTAVSPLSLAWGGVAGAGAPGYDIIVLAGQSNMSGVGATPVDTTHYDIADPRVWQYGNSGSYANVISAAIEPLAMHDSPTGIGPGGTFARWYAQYVSPQGRRVLLVPVAHGGTGLSTNTTPLGWRVGVSGNLYANALTQTQAALAAAGAGARIVGVLWVQGETDGDGSISGAQYETDLLSLIDGFRTTLSLPSLPFVIGQIVPDYLGTGSRAAIDGVHQDITKLRAFTAFAAGPSGLTMGDGNHYSPAGQRLLGRAMFDAFIAATSQAAVTSPTVPRKPLPFTVSPGNAQNSLSWGAPSDGGSTITGFKVYRGTSSGSETLLTTLGNVSTYVDTGRTNGTTYYYKVSAVNGVGESPLSSEASGTPTSGLTVSDTFTRADSTSSLGTSDTAQTWQVKAGTFGISSNRAYESAATANTLAVINSGKADKTVQVTLAVLPAAGTYARLVFRCDGTTANYWVVQANPGTAYSVYKCISGGFTQVGSNFGTPATGDVVTAVLSGSSIIVKINGTQAFTTTDAALSTATYDGIGTHLTSVARFDDYSVA